MEPATRSLRLVGKGTDSTGNSVAALSLTARIEAAPGGQSILAGASEMVMSGKAAAFGGRLMNQVADQILKQFADNFAAQAAAREAQRGSAARGVPAPAAPAPALNILALAWTLLRNWLRRLFPGSAA